MKKYRIVIFTGAAIGLPVFINFILIWKNPSAIEISENAAWLGFFGSYLGAIITGLIALYVLNINRSQADRNHAELSRLQIGTVKYNSHVLYMNEIRKTTLEMNTFYLCTGPSDFRKIMDYDYDHIHHKMTKIFNQASEYACFADLYLERPKIKEHDDFFKAIVACNQNVFDSYVLMSRYNETREHFNQVQDINQYILNLSQSDNPKEWKELAQSHYETNQQALAAYKKIVSSKLDQYRNGENNNRLTSASRNLLRYEEAKAQQEYFNV